MDPSTEFGALAAARAALVRNAAVGAPASRVENAANSTSAVGSSAARSPTKQIVFNGDPKSFCFETQGRSDVTVTLSGGQHTEGSSKVKLKSIVDYKWAQRHYPGRLITVHIDGKHIAYAIRVRTNEGMVRVVNPSNGHRALIKGMAGEMLDLQFAHIRTEMLLASLEEQHLHLHRIESTADKIVCTPLLRIDDLVDPPQSLASIGDTPAAINRLNWCPYVPEKDGDVDEYVSQQLVWIRGQQFRCFSIRALINAYGSGSRIPADLSDGTLANREQSNITGASFSPDGTTLCVSAADGKIRFYQVYFHASDTSPRCLHEWEPHQGRPISAFFFLDDLTKSGKDKTLWRYAITACSDNTEIRLWCCSTWECTQTVRFRSADPSVTLQLDAQLDRTSSYLVLSDGKQRVLYVLQVIIDAETVQPRKTIDRLMDGSSAAEQPDAPAVGRTSAYVKSISEFVQFSPILSYHIVDAAVRRYKCSYNDTFLLAELDDYDEDNQSLYCVVIHMYLVQPNSVQECHVLYQPTVPDDAAVLSSLENVNEAAAALEESADLSTTALAVDEPAPKSEAVEATLANGSAKDGQTPAKPSPGRTLGDLMAASAPNAVQQRSPGSVPVALMTPDSFVSSSPRNQAASQPQRAATPDGVSSDVRSALQMLATAVAQEQLSTHLVPKTGAIAAAAERGQSPDAVEPPSASLLAAAAAAASLASKAAAVAQPAASAGAAVPSSSSSSPSREVQAIMSPCQDGNFDCEDAVYYDDFDTDADPSSPSSTSAPKATLATAETSAIVADAKTSPSAATANGNADTVDSGVATATELHALNAKMDRMLTLMAAQSERIVELDAALATQRQLTTDAETRTVAKLTASVERLYAASSLNDRRLQAKQLDDYKKTLTMQCHGLVNELRQNLINQIPAQIGDRLSALLVAELQQRIVPLIGQRLDQIKHQIQSDVAQKLSVCDQLMRDQIAKVCSNKNTMEVFGNAVMCGVEASLQKTYSSTMKDTLVPAYEQASGEMFKQVQDVFMNGTKAYTKLFENYFAQYEPVQENLNTLAATLPEQLKECNAKAIAVLQQKITGELTRELRTLQTQMVQTVRDQLKREIQSGFDAQTLALEDSVRSVVRSQAQTPAPPAPSVYDVQEQIRNALAGGHINAAFHQALVANDLALVEFTIEKASFQAVFHPCPLEQTVLLSLIQQISADMSNHNELKQRYLAEAILNLQMNDPTTKEHAPTVLRELYFHCEQYLTLYRHSRYISGIRMLMMAIQGLNIKLM